MARGSLVIDADALGRSAIRLYLRGGGTGICADGLVARAGDCKPAWPAVLAEMIQAEKTLFETDGESGDRDDVGIPWAPNKPSYLSWKENFHNQSRPLRLSGLLEQQLTGRDWGGNRPYIKETNTTFEFGADSPVDDWSGVQAWWGDGDFKKRDQEHMISADANSGEDVAGMQSVMRPVYWGIGDYLKYGKNTNFPDAMASAPRRAVSMGPDAIAGITEVVLDHITMAPLVTRGWYNPSAQSWVPGLRRAGGTPLVEQAGRVYRTSASGRRRRIGDITT